MGWLAKICRLGLTRRLIAIVALVSFTVGTVGLPQLPGKSATHQVASLAGKSKCCCGPHSPKASCGCCQRPTAGKVAKCCQKKPSTTGKSPGPVLNCGCDEGSIPGILISSHPKIVATFVDAPQLTETFAVSLTSALGAPQAALAPDTPPPRASVS